MKRFLTCPDCDHRFFIEIGDVTPEQAAGYKAVNDTRRVLITCPNCQSDIQIAFWQIPDLPTHP